MRSLNGTAFNPPTYSVRGRSTLKLLGPLTPSTPGNTSPETSITLAPSPSSKDRLTTLDILKRSHPFRSSLSTGEYQSHANPIRLLKPRIIKLLQWSYHLWWNEDSNLTKDISRTWSQALFPLICQDRNLNQTLLIATLLLICRAKKRWLRRQGEYLQRT